MPLTFKVLIFSYYLEGELLILEDRLVLQAGHRQERVGVIDSYDGAVYIDTEDHGWVVDLIDAYGPNALHAHVVVVTLEPEGFLPVLVVLGRDLRVPEVVLLHNVHMDKVRVIADVPIALFANGCVPDVEAGEPFRVPEHTVHVVIEGL